MQVFKKQNGLPDVSARTLHILAMLFMLLDHLWATVIHGQNWLTCVGRLAFPIFAFLAVEGYFHTHDFKRYMQRLLLFAIISEVPFNLMCGGSIFYPYHQNVLWTFLIALSGVWLIERAKRRMKGWSIVLTALLISGLVSLTGTIMMTDYYGAGILMVLTFYFFRGRKWWCLLGQFLALFWINVYLLGSLYYPVKLFGMELEIVQQGFALFALGLIWLYQGRQGAHSKEFQYFCYAFYPVHIAVLVLLSALL